MSDQPQLSIAWGKGRNAANLTSVKYDNFQQLVDDVIKRTKVSTEKGGRDSWYAMRGGDVTDNYRNNKNLNSACLLTPDLDPDEGAGTSLKTLEAALSSMGINYALFSSSGYSPSQPKCHIFVECYTSSDSECKRATHYLFDELIRLGAPPVGVDTASYTWSQASYLSAADDVTFFAETGKSALVVPSDYQPQVLPTEDDKSNLPDSSGKKLDTIVETILSGDHFHVESLNIVQQLAYESVPKHLARSIAQLILHASPRKSPDHAEHKAWLEEQSRLEERLKGAYRKAAGRGESPQGDLQTLSELDAFQYDLFDIARRLDPLDISDIQQAAAYTWGVTGGDDSGKEVFRDWGKAKKIDNLLLTEHWVPQPFEKLPSVDPTKSVSADYLIARGKSEYHRKMKILSEYLALISVTGKTFVVCKSFNTRNELDIEYAKIGDTTAYYSSSKVSVPVQEDNNFKFVHKAIIPIYLQSSYCHRYSGWVFEPRPYVYATSTKLDIRHSKLNTYLGLAQQPKAAKCDLIKKHIGEVLCAGDPEKYDYVIKWFATLYSSPGEVGNVVLGFNSVEGTGKGIILGAIADSFGIHGMSLSRRGDVLGRFNDHLGQCVYIDMNETMFGGNHKEQGEMKAMITDPTLTIERKLMPIQRVNNFLHITMSSNSDWMAAVGDSDRRYVLLEPSDKYKGDTNYFNQLKTQIDNDGIWGFIHYLLNDVDLTDFNVREIDHLHSEIKQGMVIKGMDSFGSWLMLSISRGYLLDGHEDSLAQPLRIVLNEESETELFNDQMWYAYSEWFKSMPNRRQEFIEAPTTRGKTIKKLLESRGLAKRNENTNNRGWYLSPLCEIKSVLSIQNE